MRAEKVDKIATAVVLSLAGLVGLLIISFLAYLLVVGLPNVSWHFLFSPAESFKSGGGIRDQLFNSLYRYPWRYARPST